MNLKRYFTIRYSITYVFLFILSNFSIVVAQRSVGGTPVSFLAKNQSAFSKENKVVKVPALNMTRLKKEDKANSSNRFAAPVDVNYTLTNSGQWVDLADGGRVWKLEIKADNALGIFIFYKNFYLPNGARLFVYDENQKQILGGYTYLNNSDAGKFMTGMIGGETAIIEYYEPWYAKGQGRFEINRIMQAYDREKFVSNDPFQTYTGFGQSLVCNINVNCSLGNELEDQKRGVVRILTVYNTGVGWCSGSLINNTNNDGTPYVLTANHCGFLGNNIADFGLWRYDFNYAFPTCANEIDEPPFQSILGAEIVSGSTVSDFLLVELSASVPSSYNAHFNGWNRLNSPPQSSTQIHHPFGDVKKIAVDTHASTSFQHMTNWGDGIITPPHSHWRSTYDFGTIEGGSSGSPLFNQNGYIVGQLHGGPTIVCDNLITYDGKFSVSWDDGADPTTRLKEWLDPTNTGFTQLGGIDNPALANSSTVFGNIQKANGDFITNVEIQVLGSSSLTFNNQADGTYEAFDLSNGDDFMITPFRNDNHRNGVNIFDLALIRKHILGLGTPLTPYQLIAADVNNDGSVNIFDVALVQKVILQLDPTFPINSWRFVPATYIFPNPSNPFFPEFPESIFYEPILTNMQNQNFVAIKVGDVDGSAN